MNAVFNYYVIRPFYCFLSLGVRNMCQVRDVGLRWIFFCRGIMFHSSVIPLMDPTCQLESPLRHKIIAGTNCI